MTVRQGTRTDSEHTAGRVNPDLITVQPRGAKVTLLDGTADSQAQRQHADGRKVAWPLAEDRGATKAVSCAEAGPAVARRRPCRRALRAVTSARVRGAWRFPASAVAAASWLVKHRTAALCPTPRGSKPITSYRAGTSADR